MTVSAHRLAGAGEKKRTHDRFMWLTDRDPAETRDLLTAGVADRVGSWVDGDRFQIAASGDPTAPVLSGTVRSLPSGSEVSAVIACRSEVHDILRLGRLMLLGFLTVIAIALPFQVEGEELATALVGLALGCASAAAIASFIEARVANHLSQPGHVAELTRTMQRLLVRLDD